ncbi:MAG TPA: hypothetical protein ENI67_04730 [Gammaproteobacteria bacterium]|nr:hypothetical protein [Gammaproteobacteria bacterium]
MVDITRNGTFNQRREASIGVFALVESQILTSDQVATLPERVLVTRVWTNVSVASGTAGAQITVKVGSTSVATNVAVATTGLKTTTTQGYFATGGALTVVPGTTAPANGALICEVVVEYVELDRLNGSYIG